GACAGADSGQSEATAVTDPGSPAPDATAAGGGRADADLVAQVDTPDGRKVIHRASIAIEATDTRAVYQDILALVEASGGFVGSADIADPDSGEDQPRITMTIRIPATDLATSLEAIAALGTRVVTQSQQGQDVTEEYVDVEARIDNLTLLETELRELLEDVRAQADVDPAKLLQVFNEISRVRGEIEQFEGRIQVLDDLTSLATVDVSIVPTPAVTPVVDDEWAPLSVARGALADLVSAFHDIADVGIRLVVYVLPILLVLVVIPGIVIWQLRNRWTRRHPPAGPPQEKILETADK
ncbi:MAG TPA: DUF4349 domain-containing protein, partial [Acidimicrobiia bacterium]|nr:DUF4349 domain-containing protein [Acidimicrobiia bacterium]